jgi:FG-GAP repeat
MIVGAPGESIGTVKRAGGVNVIYGSASGITATNNQFWSQDSSSIQDIAEAEDKFGAVLTTGDFNKDGYMDAVIAAPGESISSVTGAGAVNILYGSATGLSDAKNQVLSQDTTGVLESAEIGDNFGLILLLGFQVRIFPAFSFLANG